MKNLGIYFLGLCFFCSVAWAKFESSGLELIYTQPVETNLVLEGVRGPVEAWSEMIDNAKKEIDFQEVYASGKTGEPLDTILEKMEQAVTRGVKIKFILEEGMKRATDEETLSRLKKMKNTEVRFIKYASITGGGINHSKFLVVDSKVGFVGSQNFDWKALKHIHETGFMTADRKIVGQMKAIFDQDWNAAGLLAKGKNVPVLQKKPFIPDLKQKTFLVASPWAWNPKGVGDSESVLPMLMKEAKEEIRVQLLDYYPLNRDKTFYPVIDNAVREAQARHVKIKLLVSHWNTSRPGIDHLKSLTVLPDVEVRITTIPEAKEGFIPFARVIHSKVMTIDGKLAWVGTSNWTGGYLTNNRNLEIVARDEKLAKKLVEMHEQLWNAPYTAAVDIKKNYEKPKKGE